MNKKRQNIDHLFVITVLSFIVFAFIHLMQDHAFDAIAYGTAISTLFAAHRSFKPGGHIENLIDRKYACKRSNKKEIRHEL